MAPGRGRHNKIEWSCLNIWPTDVAGCGYDLKRTIDELVNNYATMSWGFDEFITQHVDWMFTRNSTCRLKWSAPLLYSKNRNLMYSDSSHYKLNPADPICIVTSAITIFDHDQQQSSVTHFCTCTLWDLSKLSLRYHVFEVFTIWLLVDPKWLLTFTKNSKSSCAQLCNWVYQLWDLFMLPFLAMLSL